ncbi:hypothetical protein [Halobellus rubicundus]|uniref:CopG family transcriptional regulator n=1 Tax=Halobellus rubicundus TaxID=2996466 RepID=A0ABD5MDU1_9EURY
MPNPVDPPKADPLDVDDDDVAIEPRSYEELLAPVMELRDCSRPKAGDYIDTHGREQVERELQARWL